MKISHIYFVIITMFVKNERVQLLIISLHDITIEHCTIMNAETIKQNIKWKVKCSICDHYQLITNVN